MVVNKLFQGHYRSLEPDFVRLLSQLEPDGGSVWVTAAGAEQLDRLRELVLEDAPGPVVGGIRFLPGIRHLAQKLREVPAPLETVSHSDRTLLTLEAMSELKPGEPLYDLRGNPDTALSLGTFFEDLFEHGIRPDLYEISTLSLSREQTATERTVGRLLHSYHRERSECYSSCGDMIMDRDVPPPAGDVFVFYGFYDLNPLQRRFIRGLLPGAKGVYWFSPVSENSPWSGVYRRTGKLLAELGTGPVERSGMKLPMNRFAAFFQSLRTQDRPSPPMPGFRITAVTGEMGSCRAALDRISELSAGAGVPLPRIAVARRKQGGGILARLAHHEGVRIKAPLTTPLSRMPQAGFLMDLLEFLKGDFYYSYLESLLSRGMLREAYDVDPSAVAEILEEEGVRMGRERWRDWYSAAPPGGLEALLRELDTFFGSVPGKASPGRYLSLLEDLCGKVARTGHQPRVWQAMFDPRQFRCSREMSMEEFSSALELQYRRAEVVLREADPEGFHLLTVEKLRGCSYRSVILMDMEEGTYPRPQVEDPRLSEELRTKLQLSLKSQREMEDGLLLRQAGEAAEESLDIIYREQESDGGDIAPSPFIAPLVAPFDGSVPDPEWFRRTSSSPVGQLLGGEHPGQLRAAGALEGELPDGPVFAEALTAENSRMDFHGFDRYDGILEDAPPLSDTLTPTMLESYVRCPFAFLAERIWKLDRAEPQDIGSVPEPATKGNIVHEAVEGIVERWGFGPRPGDVRSFLQEKALSKGLPGLLGTEYLCEMFIENQTEVILQSLENLRSRGWRFLAGEQALTGRLDRLNIRGRIDLVLEDRESNLVLVDLKTGKLPSRKDVEKATVFQLPFYFQLAAGEYPGREISLTGYVSISQRTPGRVLAFSAAEMAGVMGRARENAARLAGMMERGLFPPVPTGWCRSCLYRGLCRLTPTARIRAKVLSDSRMEFFHSILKVR
ncbi:MAG: PD-(D/E)XK nuclease family protein [Candidatus Aegiribacteria sp.]